MSEKFIPGPYCVEDISSEAGVDICLDYNVPGGGSPIPIAQVFFDEDVDRNRPPHITPQQANATAILFAASDALLEACKRLRSRLDAHMGDTDDAYDDDDPDMEAMQFASAAIEKATSGATR